MNSHIFVMIRYSVLTESKSSWAIGRDEEVENYKRKLFLEARLDLHQDLFFNATLPSVRKLNPDKSTVLIFTSDELPSFYINSLNNEIKNDKNIKVISLPRTGRIVGQMHNVLNEELHQLPEDTLYATVRLDDDDILSSSFQDSLEKYMNKAFVGYAISFSKGIAGIYEAGRYVSFYEIVQPKIALGLSFINFYSRKNGLDCPPVSIYGLGNHTKIDENHPLIIESKMPLYIRTVHSQSDAFGEKLKNKMMSGKEIEYFYLSDF